MHARTHVHASCAIYVSSSFIAQMWEFRENKNKPLLTSFFFFFINKTISFYNLTRFPCQSFLRFHEVVIILHLKIHLMNFNTDMTSSGPNAWSATTRKKKTHIVLTLHVNKQFDVHTFTWVLKDDNIWINKTVLVVCHAIWRSQDSSSNSLSSFL